MRIEHALHRHGHGRLAQVHAVLLGELHDLIPHGEHRSLLRLLNALEIPEEIVAALHPLVIRHEHAAGIRQNIGHNHDAPLVEDGVARARRRPVCAFDDDARLDVSRVVFRDDGFDSRGHDGVDVQ